MLTNTYSQSNFGQNLVYGGPQSVLMGLLVAFVAQFTVTLGLAEIASAFPVSEPELPSLCRALMMNCANVRLSRSRVVDSITSFTSLRQKARSASLRI